MGDWKRKSIAGGPTPEMGDWKRRSIAGGPSPEAPSEIIPGALPLDLDFFYHPSAAFPCDRADHNGGHRRMAVTPPVTMAPPSQAQQCQTAGTAPTGGNGLRRGGSRLRVKVPSASQLPPLPEDAAAIFDNIEFYSEDEEEAGEEEESLSSGRSEEEGETMSSGSSEEEGETMSSASDEEEGETMSSGSGEEEAGEAMSPGRGEGEEAGEKEGEEAAMLPGGKEDDQGDAMLYCNEGEEAFLSQSEEEEPEEVRAMCAHCNSLERLVKLLPCRHASYCDRCFALYDRRSTPARPQLCPVCWKPYTRGHPESGGMGNSKSKAIEGDNVSDVSTGMVNSNSKATEDDKVSYVATGDFIDQGMHADDDDADQINIDVENVDEYNANGIAVDDNDDNEYSTGPGVGNSKSKATEDDIVSDVAAEDMGAFISTIVDDDTISSSFIDDEYYLFRSQVFNSKDSAFQVLQEMAHQTGTTASMRSKTDDSIQLRKQLMIQMLTIKHNEAAGNIPAEIREALRVITD
ncbi:hypothetical protein ZWY2020_013086 [Hordeum vulgare]|nr:hypothetical protein ZWY2020_013086 [Hordeum vulgare]